MIKIQKIIKNNNPKLSLCGIQCSGENMYKGLCSCINNFHTGLHLFQENLAKNQKNLDSDSIDMVNEHFWDLL